VLEVPKRIFVVEDEALVAMELKDHLQALGYEVCGHAARGEAALVEIPDARPDLILLDITLAGELSGLDVAEGLRGRVDAPVLFLTAHSDLALTERAARTGSFAYLVKPFDARVLNANLQLAFARHEAEAFLRKSEARFRALFDGALDGLFEVKRDGTIIRVNPAFAQMLGHESPEALRGANQTDFYADPDQRRRIQETHEQHETIHGVEASWRKKDGEPLIVELFGRIVRGEGGEITGYHGSIRDVTAARAQEARRAAAEREREHAELRFAGVFEQAPDSLLIVNEAGRIVMANGMAEATLGYTRDELQALYVEALVPEAKRSGHRELRAGFMSAGQPRRMGSARSLLWAVRKDGGKVPVEITLSPLDAPDGRLVVVALRDVQERVRAEVERARLEEQLRHAQKLDALGTLAAGIAHDFNNLLAAITGNVDLALLDVPTQSPLHESLKEISIASGRASELVKQILAFSRQQPTRKTITSVRPVVSEVVRLLRATLPAGIELVMQVDEPVSNVMADAAHLHQILMNLGTNAWHAIERTTGCVTFRLDVVTVVAGAAPAAGMAPGRYVRIQVQDDGKGMDVATVKRVFEPFFTTKEIGKGTGLGLAVVHGILSDHGGGVRVESVPGKGTTFSVYVPEADGEPEAQRVNGSPSGRGAGGRVLLIDDEEPLVRVALRGLERLGYQARGFVRAEEALDVLTAEPERFDVVITDLNMPQMGGLEVARAVGTLRKDLPVVLASGNFAYSAAELAASNVSHTLGKPYSLDALRDALAVALQRT
jgi:two-component system cell cycle sensor histidine kinase/response regulator CckA